MPAPTVRYEFTNGWGGATTSAGTMTDLSGNGNTGTVVGMTTNSNWLTNHRGGMLHIDNASVNGGKSVLTPSSITHSNTYSVSIGIQYITMQGYPNIICGAYASSTHDWWIGWNTPGAAFTFRRNGVVLDATTIPAVNGTYIVGISNNSFTNTGVFNIYSLPSAAYSFTKETVTVSAAYPASTAGRIGICKYGGYTDFYQPNIRVGHFLWWNGAALTNAEHDTVADLYKLKYLGY
jgi:hypothetical protein